MKNKAVFLNREGTLIEDAECLKEPSKIVFFSSAFPALKMLQQNGFMLFIVLNQPGISKGELSSEEAGKVNFAISERFAKEGIKLVKIYVCPHSLEDKCLCCKPNPYFLYEAAKEFNINLAGSYFIGSHPDDINSARRADVTGIYILSDIGIKYYHEITHKPLIKANILDAAKFIINQINKV